MGTLATIHCYAPDPTSAQLAANAAFARLEEIETFTSDYRTTSQVSQIRLHAGGDWTEINSDLFELLITAKKLSENSHGAFDITARPLIQLWKHAARENKRPQPEKIQLTRSLVDWQTVELKKTPTTYLARLSTPQSSIDLGGIGKGWAAEEMINTLRDAGITHALVAIAGDISASAPPPGTQAWPVTILPQGPSRPTITEKITLAHAAVSTSGDAHQHYHIDGIRYSHIIDPRRGEPLSNGRSVTVRAPHGIDADSLATTLCILGPDAASDLLPPNSEATFYENDNGTITKLKISAQTNDHPSP